MRRGTSPPHRAHEGGDHGRVLVVKGIGRDELDGAEAAAAETVQFVDAQHPCGLCKGK